MNCSVESCERVVRYVGPRLCNMHYQRLWKYGSTDDRTKPTVVNCAVADCTNKPRSRQAAYCEVHYYRLRRTGSTELTPKMLPKYVEQQGGGYLLVEAGDHPLRTSSSNRIYEHRKVYYAAHGEGPFACFHCGDFITWDDMHVDHLNDNPTDNRVENLAASCPACNQKRGHHKMAKTLRRKHATISFQGETLCKAEWSERLGISPQALTFRLENGWPIERALTAPRGVTGPKRKAA